MQTPDGVEMNIDKIAALFPNCITEDRNENGEVKRAIDFDLLRQELSTDVVEGVRERYTLNWPGKNEAIATANAPIDKTLRPCREESVGFDSTENLYIEGDNLEALKLLQETYLGKVKMIYIDPPYNTGKDFVYSDNFTADKDEYELESGQRDEAGGRLVANPESNGRFHSDWLSMMYSRLKLARNLLKDDGVIVIHIDEHEYCNLEKLLNELFGEDNNLGTIVWDKRNPKGDATGIAYQHELISFYCKSRTAFTSTCELKRPKENAEAMLKMVDKLIRSAGGVTDNVRDQFKKWLKKQDFSGGEKAYNLIDDSGRLFQSVSMAWPNKKKAPDDYFLPLIHPRTHKECPVPDRGWRNPSATMKKLLNENQIIFGRDESTQPRRKYFLDENMYENVSSLLYFGGSDDAILSELDVVFDTPKVVAVSKKLIQPVCSDDDIICDFFAGSSTAAHAVMQLNSEDGGRRKFIMVQLPEECDEKSDAFKAGYKTIPEIGKERIRRAGKRIKEENATTAADLDIGFRVLKVDESNMNDVYYTPDQLAQDNIDLFAEHIKGDRTAEDLLFQVMLDWGVPLSAKIEKQTIDGKNVYLVNENDLLACFDQGINEEMVKKLAGHQPMRAIFRDDAFESDSLKINVDQIFKVLSPSTEVKSI